MGRGNMIGKPNLPATTAAGGVWGMREQYTANRASEWPGYDPQWSKTTLLLKTEAGVTSTDSRAYSTYGTPTISSSGGPYAGFGSVTIDTGSAQESVYVSDAAMAIGNGNFTVEAWVKVNSYTGGVIATSRWTATQSNIYWLMYVGSTGRPCFVTRSNSFYTDFGANSTTNTVPLNTWTHWAGVREGGVLKLYINGVLQNVTQSDGGVDLTEQAVSIGFFNYSGYTAGSNATISGFRLTKSAVYTANFTPSTTKPTALTNNVLLLNFDGSAGTFSDETGKNTLTSTATVVATPAPKFGADSMLFSGSTSITATASAGNTLAGNFAFGTGDFTIEAWVYPTSSSGDRCIFSTRGNQATSVYFGCYTNAYTLGFYTAGAWILQSTRALQPNTWSHVVLQRANGVVYFFIDGIPAGSAANTTNLSDSTAAVGRSVSDNAYGWIGQMDEVRVTKAARYTGTFIPSPTPFDRDWEPLYNDTQVTANRLMVKTLDVGGVNNNIFRDDSANAFSITRVGDTTQGTLSPFYPTGYWSNYFDGTGDYLTVPSTSGQLGAGNFTVECWVNLNPKVSLYPSIFTNYSTWGAGALGLYAGHNSGTTTKYNVGVNGTFPAINSVVDIIYGKWTHLALVRSGTTITLYVDGVANGTFTSNATLNQAGSLWIGTAGDQLANGGINGHISNFRVVVGTAVYTSDFSPPSAPLTAITNTTVLTCQDNRFIDRSANNFSITRFGDATTSRFDPFPLTVPVVTAPAAVAPSGSVYFDGNGDTITTPSNAAYQMGAGDWTMECWIYPQNANGCIYADRTGGDYSGLVIALQSNKIGMVVNLGGGWNINTWGAGLGTLTAPTNQWSHIAVSRESSNWRVFINGGLAYTVTGSGTAVQSSATIGNDPGATSFFNGWISNFRITKSAVYTAAFTPPTTALTAIANTGLLTCQSSSTVTDASTNNLVLTRNGDAKAADLSPFPLPPKPATYTYGGSGYFDGTGDRLGLSVNAALNPAGGNFTFECWVNPANWSGNSAALYVNLVNTGLWIGKLGANFVVRSAYVADLLQYGTLPTVGAWTHVVVVRSGTTLSLFYNGVRVATTTNSTTFVQGPVWVGDDGDGSSYLTGYISNLRLVKGTAVYDPTLTTLSVPTAPLTAITNTTLLLNFDNAGVYDAAGINVLGTAGSATSNGSIRKYENSLAFDGTSGGVVNVSHPAPHLALGTGDFTIEFWAYRTVSAPQVLYGQRPSTTQGAYPTIYCESATLYYYTNSGNQINGGTLGTGSWNHIAVCRAASQTRMFVNGIQVGATVADTTNYLNPTTRPYIGGNDYFTNNTGDYRFTGYLEGLRVSRTARYVTNFTVPSASLPLN